MSNHRYSPEFKDEAVRQIIEAGHSVSIGKDYPAPIVEHKRGRERALEAYQAMRSATAE